MFNTRGNLTQALQQSTTDLGREVESRWQKSPEDKRPGAIRVRQTAYVHGHAVD
jgi:hypothetical protein